MSWSTHGVLEGCNLTVSTTAMTWSITEGRVIRNNVPLHVAAQTGTLSNSDTAFDRYDTFTISSSGTVQVTTGTPSDVPTVDVSGDDTVLYHYLVPTGATSLTATNVQDVRYQSEPLSFLNVHWWGAKGDGVTDDSAAVSAAISAADAYQTATGSSPVMEFPTGTYLASISLDIDRGLTLRGQGTVIQPPAGGVGIDITTATNGADAIGNVVEGFIIDAGANTGCTGIRITNSDRNSIRNFRILNCDVGIEFKSDTAGWVEGTLLSNGFIYSCGTGIWFNTTATGTGSFGETVMLSVGINNCDPGILVDTNAVAYRTVIHGGTIWINNNQTGIVIDGDVINSDWQVGIETLDTGTGTVGVDITSNAYNTWAMRMMLGFTGPIATKVQSSSAITSESLVWQESTSDHYQINDYPVFRAFKAGETYPRFQLEASSAGSFSFGGGSSGPDANFYRLSAGVLKSDHQFQAVDGLTTIYKSGAGKTTIVDGDFSHAPADGTLAVHRDTTANKIYLSVRAAGTWHVMAGPI